MPALNELFELGNFIDSFALGHYARVLDAIDKRTHRPVAFKIMRTEHRNPDGAPKWEAQAFVHEARLLSMLAEHPTPMNFYDCGYISSNEDYPASGEIVSYGDDIHGFSSTLYETNSAGWRPYLVLENLPRNNSLLYLMQAKKGQRRRLPTEEGIDLAIQFGHLLQYAHERGITYMDHKLEHIYWDGHTLRVIDWNSSKLIDNAANLEQERQKDIHNLCVGVLYPIFTGLSSKRGMLRPQPGNRAEVNARYSDVTELDFGVEPTLSNAVINLLESGARQQVGSADEFLSKVERAAMRFGWDGSSPVLTDARDQMREALVKLRYAEDLVRESRELFLSAATLDGINEDMEGELRRMLKGINEFLNMRVIP